MPYFPIAQVSVLLFSLLVLLAQHWFPIVFSSLLVSCLNVDLLIIKLMVVWCRLDSLVALVRYQCEYLLLVDLSSVWLLVAVVPWLHPLSLLVTSSEINRCLFDSSSDIWERSSENFHFCCLPSF